MTLGEVIMSALNLQRILFALLVIFAVAIVVVWTVVPHGPRGHIRGISEAIAYGLFGVTLLCAVTVHRECSKLSDFEDAEKKRRFERKLARGVAWVYVGLAASFPIGYFIGVRMLE